MLHLKEHLAGKSHVVWDWNGTLLDDLDVCVEIVSAVAERHVGKKLTREAYLAGFRFPVREWYRDMGFDFERVSFEELSVDFVASYVARAPGLALFEGVRELLQELQESGIRCSILTAAHQSVVDQMLAHFGIRDFFHEVYGLGDHHATSKVQRGRQLLAQLGLPREELVLVGDTDHDLEVARDLGIDAVLLEGGHQCGTRLRQLHHAVLAR